MEQSLARIKAVFLLAREEYDEQLVEERARTENGSKQLAEAVVVVANSSKQQSKMEVTTSLDVSRRSEWWWRWRS